MKIEVAEPGSPWTLFDDRCPDVYFTAGYGTAAALGRRGRWQALHSTDAVMVPYILSEAGGGALDAASPYGYSGIHVAPHCPPADLRRFWELAGEHWRDLGVAAVFFRFSPLDPASVDAVTGLAGLELTRRGDTVTVDVGGGADAVWNRLEGRARTAVRRAVNAGLSCHLRPATAQDVRADSPFRQLYEHTMRRVGSAPGYLFGDDYYTALLDGVGAGLLLAEVRRPDGQHSAAALILVHRERVHYHLSGSGPEAPSTGAGNLLLWTVLRWAAQSGRSTVHLGGGLTPDDGLFRFKRSFGGRRTAFWTGATVVDELAYRRLVEHRAASLAVPVETLLSSGYFPAYRFGANSI